MEFIQSVHNPKIKAWYQLHSKKGRDTSGSYLIEGAKLIAEAIQADQEIEVLLIEHEKGIPREINALIADKNEEIPIVKVTPSIIEKLSEMSTPQGMMAVVKQKHHTMAQILERKPSFILLVDEIQDPGNLGAMIRSADAAGVEAIILGNGTVDLYNSKVIRSAMGSLFHLPILSADLSQLIPQLQHDGFQVIGTSSYAEKSYFDIDYTKKTAILVGNEARGMSEDRKKQVTEMVKIPLMGQAESLNVTMATTVILYERVRQFQKADKL